MTKWIMFLILIFLSQTAQAHHRPGHQNQTPPYSEFNRTDCGTLYDGINIQKRRTKILMKIAKEDPGQSSAVVAILPEELSRLKAELYMYYWVCKEV